MGEKQKNNMDCQFCHVISHGERRNKEFPLPSVFELAKDWPLKDK